MRNKKYKKQRNNNNRIFNKHRYKIIMNNKYKKSKTNS